MTEEQEEIIILTDFKNKLGDLIDNLHNDIENHLVATADEEILQKVKEASDMLHDAAYKVFDYIRELEKGIKDND